PASPHRRTPTAAGHSMAGQPDAHPHHPHLDTDADRHRNPAAHRPPRLRRTQRCAPRADAPLRLATHDPPSPHRPPAHPADSTMTAVDCQVQLTAHRSAVRLCIPPDQSARLGAARLLPASITINGHHVRTTLHKMASGYLMAVNAE